VDSNDSNSLKIFLKYKNGKPVINTIKVISKPSKRIYWSIKQIWKINSSKNFIIFSTNKGLKSVIDCKKLRIGGEPFISIK
jgi:small subunit ribosomal protein S8